MPEEQPQVRSETRRLAAIMFTDIVGFSRQMGADEARMLRLLEVHNQLIQQAVTTHHGMVIKTVGDAFLVDFPSVVHAVQCAQKIQSQFRTHNTEQENAEQIHVRIGIHLGDIVQKDGDVFGDGVNIAARLQGLAEPDTICISDVVYRDVVKKLDVGTVVSLGKPKLKNIAERFTVYALLPQSPKGIRQTIRIQYLKLSRRVRSTTPVVLLCLAFLGSGLFFSRLLLTDLLPENKSADPLSSTYERAFVDLNQGHIDQALTTFQELVTMPNNPLGLGYDGLAAIYFVQGKLAETTSALQQATIKNPPSVVALVTQGDLAFSMGDREKATAAYLQATQSETTHGWQAALAYNALGVSYAVEGAQDQARAAFTRAFQADAHSAEAASNLGALAWRAGNATEAKQWLEKAQAVHPEDELTQLLLAWITANGELAPHPGGTKKILLVPLSLGGGNLRRLGEGEALAWQVAQALTGPFAVELVHDEAIATLTAEDSAQAVSTLRALAKDKGATHLVWGEYQRLGAQLNVFGQLVSTESEATRRFNVVADGSTPAIATAAQQAARKIIQSITQEKDSYVPR